MGVPLVATNDMHYLKPEDYDAQDVLLCLQTKRKKTDADRMEMHGRDFYYKSAKRCMMFRAYPGSAGEYCKNRGNVRSGDRIGEYPIAAFDVPEGYDGNSYLEKKCRDGLEKKIWQDL